jgi:hypothetical protein
MLWSASGASAWHGPSENSRGRAELFIDYSEEARTFRFLLQWQFILSLTIEIKDHKCVRTQNQSRYLM